MSNFPQSVDIFVNKTGANDIGSSDPNNAYDAIEVTQGLIGALGEPQTWSTTLTTLIRRYKRGMYVNITSGAITVRSGEAVLENTDGTKFAFRRNTGDVSIGVGNIDVGTLIATTYYIYATAKGAATTTPLMFSTDALAPSGIGTAPYRRIGWFENLAVGSLATSFAGEYDAEPTGKILQICNFQSGLVGSGTTLVPNDDTIPQITEGDEYMRLAIVPTSATSKLKIDVVFHCATGAQHHVIAALFQDTNAGAIAAARGYNTDAQGHIQIVFTHHMVAGVTSAIIFTVRAGSYVSEVLTFNGNSSARYLGGVMASSITITEIAS